MSIIHFFTRLLRCHGTKNQIACSAFIGVFLGLVPLLGWSWVIFAVMLLLLRLSIPTALLVAATFRIVGAYGLDYLSSSVGRHLLEDYPSLTVFWGRFSASPGIAFLEIDRYSVLGSWILSLFLGFAMWGAVHLLALGLKNSRLHRFSQDNRVVIRYRRRLGIQDPLKGNHFLRPQISIALAIFLFAGIAVFVLANGPITSWAVECTLASYLGTPVVVEDSSFNYFSGDLAMHKLEIRDPLNPAEDNLFTADSVEMSVDPVAIFKKQFFIHEAIVKGATLYLSRDAEKTINFTHLQAFRQFASKSPPGDWLSQLQHLTQSMQKWNEHQEEKKQKLLEEYVVNHPGVSEEVILALKKENLQALSQLVELSPKYLWTSLGRPSYTRKRRTELVFGKLELDELQLVLHNRAKKSSKTSLQGAMLLQNFSLPLNQERKVDIQLRCHSIPLQELEYIYDTTSPVLFTNGSLAIRASLASQHGYQQMQGIALLKQLEIQNTTKAPMQGMRAEEFVSGINKAKNFQVPFVFFGKWGYWQLQFPDDALKKVAQEK